jgi:hypothetical protein
MPGQVGQPLEPHDLAHVGQRGGVLALAEPEGDQAAHRRPRAAALELRAQRGQLARAAAARARARRRRRAVQRLRGGAVLARGGRAVAAAGQRAGQQEVREAGSGVEVDGAAQRRQRLGVQPGSTSARPSR